MMISKKLDLAIKLNFHKIISLKKSKVGGVGYRYEGELNAMKKMEQLYAWFLGCLISVVKI